MTAAPKERQPRTSEWQRRSVPNSLVAESIAASSWVSGPVWVLSSISAMELPGGSGVGLQWLISISHKGKRPKPHEVRRTLRAFGMADAEEDNHGPGNTRAFFLVVDPAFRVGCECKTTETVMRDPDGYTFSVATDPAECGGCALEPVTGRACPRHRPA